MRSISACHNDYRLVSWIDYNYIFTKVIWETQWRRIMAIRVHTGWTFHVEHGWNVGIWYDIHCSDLASTLKGYFYWGGKVSKVKQIPVQKKSPDNKTEHTNWTNERICESQLQRNIYYINNVTSFVFLSLTMVSFGYINTCIDKCM